MSFIWFILIGLAAGYIGARIMKRENRGAWFNLIIGVVGGVLGGWVFSLFGIHTGSLFGSLITSIIGAILLLWLASWISHPRQ